MARMEADGPTWSIIGGGPHGVHIAARLIGEAGVDPDDVRIVDPGSHLLTEWRRRARATGMEYLRSPSVHHVGVDPLALFHFRATSGAAGSTPRFRAPYNRPALWLFESHCDAVIDHYGLDRLHIRDRVSRIDPTTERVHLQMQSGEALDCGHVVIAIGSGDRSRWPDAVPRNDPRIRHVYGLGSMDEVLALGRRVVVVGGGLAAGHLCVSMIGDEHEIVLVSRHSLHERQFDTDPGWIGPKFMSRFSRTQDLVARREMIRSARRPATMPPEILSRLRAKIRSGQVEHRIAAIDRVDAGRDLVLTLSTGESVEADIVILATGFEPSRPGGPLVDDLQSRARLPLAPCGFPIVDHGLRWHRRVFVTGALAELELGPTARNIIGARNAAERILRCRLDGRSETKEGDATPTNVRDPIARRPDTQRREGVWARPTTPAQS